MHNKWNERARCVQHNRYEKTSFTSYFISMLDSQYYSPYGMKHAHVSFLISHENTSNQQRHMMTSSHGNFFCVTGPLCAEFTGHRWIPHKRPVTRSYDVFFDLRLNKWSSKQSWGWWFETQSRSWWRHCNGVDRSQLMHQIIKLTVYLNAVTDAITHKCGGRPKNKNKMITEKLSNSRKPTSLIVKETH